MPVFLNPIVDISPAITGSWQEVDLSAHCPAGTTGVVLKIINWTMNYSIGFRKKGSTDDRYRVLGTISQNWGACGVDANRVLEIKRQHTDLKVYLIGYFGAEGVFLTNGIEKVPGGVGAWKEVDLSADVLPGDVAKLAFLEFTYFPVDTLGLRIKGSTDDRKDTVINPRMGVVGVDGNKFEVYIGDATSHIHLLGYLTAGVVVSMSEQDVTPGTKDAWVDLAALPAGAIGGIYQLHDPTSSSYQMGMRCNGAAETTTRETTRLCWAMPKCDVNGIVECQVKSLATNDVYQLGYFTEYVLPTITDIDPDHGAIGDAITITGTGFGATQGTGTVTIGGTGATVVTWSDTEIVITVPAGATSGDLVVTNGTGGVSDGASFIAEAPAPAMIESGCPGETITITGLYFGVPEGTVAFGALPAMIVSWAADSIDAIIPVGTTDCTLTVMAADAKAGTIAFALGDCGGASSTPETPIHTGNPIGAGPNVGLSPVR